MNSLKTVLVTGGAGYVGSVLVPKLLAAGYRVKVLDLYVFGDHVLDAVKDHPRLEQIKGDMRDGGLLGRGRARLRRRHPSGLHLQRPELRAGPRPGQVDQLRLLLRSRRSRPRQPASGGSSTPRRPASTASRTKRNVTEDLAAGAADRLLEIQGAVRGRAAARSVARLYAR